MLAPHDYPGQQHLTFRFKYTTQPLPEGFFLFCFNNVSGISHFYFWSCKWGKRRACVLSFPFLCPYRIIPKMNWQGCRHSQCHDLGRGCKILLSWESTQQESNDGGSPGMPGNREEATATSYQMEFQKVVPLKTTLDQAALQEKFFSYNSVIVYFCWLFFSVSDTQRVI